MVVNSLCARLGYRIATWALTPAVRMILSRRLAQGKEDPERWPEKLGHTAAKRPRGRLVWLHGVGLGEVLSSRPIIDAMTARNRDLQFLVTSSTRASAQVFAQHMPPSTQHQFLPLDTPGAVARFLNHWDPDLSVWLEQDMWPGLVFGCQKRGIPLAFVNGRMHGASAGKRRKAGGVLRAAYRAFDLIAAQDAASAENLADLSGKTVQTLPNLKSVSAALSVDRQALADWRARLADRAVWAVGSAHMSDIPPALEAHRALIKRDPRAALIILPRDASDVDQIRTHAAALGSDVALTGDGRPANILIDPGFGQSGLWYSLSAAALIGGGFDSTGGHNPWEAVHLGCGVIHGPNTANFSDDYVALTHAGGAVMVKDGAALETALTQTDFSAAAANAVSVAQSHHTRLSDLFDHLTKMVRTRL